MTKLRVTKEFTFEMAHALSRYDGKCENVHGHTYFLSITIAGEPGEDTSSSKCGMVMDFCDLKLIVKDHILDYFDHALVLNVDDPRKHVLKNVSTRLILTPYQPTCENLILDIVRRISVFMGGPVKLFSVKLRETPTSYAEWFAGDNTNHQQLTQEFLIEESVQSDS
jgi:6-pyruvoyltetrahydropterin/6-carboxytetrahydropterin synthase